VYECIDAQKRRTLSDSPCETTGLKQVRIVAESEKHDAPEMTALMKKKRKEILDKTKQEQDTKREGR
jgi:hypothetical protein